MLLYTNDIAAITVAYACSQFGEEDPDLVQSAINRFVRSCAGYSVATYVLV